MNQTDLHVHSGFSNDGELKICEIVAKCVINGIDTLSVTDHNSTKGIEEAVSLAALCNIDLIPGIEIDCNYNNIDLHLLGYNIDWRSKDFADLENAVNGKVMDSFPEMIENLAKVGIEVNAAEVLDRSNGQLPCAELIAEVLLSNNSYSNKKLLPYQSGGNRSEMPYINFYLDYFAQGKPAYVEINHMSYADAIELVMDNGGTPIIAHPGVNLKGNEKLITDLLEHGAQGLEAFNNYHNRKQIDYFAEIARQRNILITCGSDFHGKNKPLIEIGNYNFNEQYLFYLLECICKLKTYKHDKQ